MSLVSRLFQKEPKRISFQQLQALPPITSSSQLIQRANFWLDGLAVRICHQSQRWKEVPKEVIKNVASIDKMVKQYEDFSVQLADQKLRDIHELENFSENQLAHIRKVRMICFFLKL